MPGLPLFFSLLNRHLKSGCQQAVGCFFDTNLTPKNDLLPKTMDSQQDFSRQTPEAKYP